MQIRLPSDRESPNLRPDEEGIETIRSWSQSPNHRGKGPNLRPDEEGIETRGDFRFSIADLRFKNH